MAITTGANYARYHVQTYPFINPTQPHLSNAGKTVLVTGGGSGIGAQIAESFAKSRASHLILVGRTSATLSANAARLSALYPETKIHTFVADATDAAAVDACFEKASQEIGVVDVLVNNAGYLSGPAPLTTNVDLKDWWKGFEINVLGVALFTKAFLKHGGTADAKERIVITVNTLVAHYLTAPGGSSYAASKLAALRIMEVFAVENPEVRFISLHPGGVDTAMFEKSKLEKKGMTDIELSADATVWLAGPDAGFLSGRLVWVNWDMEDLVAKKDEIVKKNELVAALRGVEGDLLSMRA